ncbi:MAG: hypothetical protein ABSF67_09020 [Roseiarcus sp.]|jgi:hypothetical protein
MTSRRLVVVGFARIVVAAAGAIAVLWSVQSVRLSWSHVGLSNAALAVVNQQPFKTDLLERLEPSLEAVEAESTCAPAALHDAAVIRLRLAETAMAAGKRVEIDPALQRLDAAVRKSLRCSPMDSFLWLALYWEDVQTNGVRPDSVAPLEMSYRLGPNEGWIAIGRSRYGLAAFDYVSSTTKDAILDEERALLDAGLVEEVADNLTGSGWPIRDLILARLETANAENREQLARRLRRDGYDVSVPGVALKEARPWD